MQMGSSTDVAYITIEAINLLNICFEELNSLVDRKSRSELMLRGTLPKNTLKRIQDSFVLIDNNGLRDRFTAKRRIYVDSWSELVALGSITRFYEAAQKMPAQCHYIACVGIETAFKDSGSREKYLGDGAVASRELNGRQIIQSCLAQNIKGSSAGKDLDQEIITRLGDKLRKAPDEPTQILAVTILSETDTFDSIDFSQIASDIAGQAQEQDVYQKIFCIIPGFSNSGIPQVAVIPLWDWLPGGNRLTVALSIGSDQELESSGIKDIEFFTTPA